MASEMLSKVLDAENSDKEAQKAAHEQAHRADAIKAVMETVI